MRLSHLIVGLAALALATARPLHAEETANGPVYVVTYFDVAPPAAAQTAALARQFVEASRKEAGNMGFEVFEEIGRANRLAILETWRDKQAYEAHGAAASTTAFRDKLQPLLIGGTGIRVFGGLSVAAPSGRPGPRTLYVLAHVDVFPAGKDQAVDLVRALADAGRKDNGNLWFDVLQQDGRPNHFTLFEGWRDRKAFDASITTAHTKEFRQKLNPLEGALYDERLYQAVH
ncbi:MAG TPA: putative quinol monooxygenase [Stellaceae bacterium]|nr:putative quinol monooxygenase [Stellaceae bacterium]